MTYGTLVVRNPRTPSATNRRRDHGALGLHRAFTTRDNRLVRAPAGPRFDALETEEDFQVRAEVPGYGEADLDLSISEGVLTVKSRDVEVEEGAEEVSDSPFAANESFERRFRFSDEVDEDAIQASYKNGVLLIRLPKRVAPEPVVREVPINVA